ncbi:glycosyltransferase family 2 protein [Amnibacterium setariae]|uniref:glycosyltransferase family 2 protein n=1 Tax=Amnibacterium setariae TaxID=2306585 RepID=UPI0013142790|nr:glycosyltransferase family 2 protein [Amnibacterium setariae]
MRVSVVVPVHDPGRWITDLLDSLRAQTLDPADFEVVFVDDGSTDGTPDLLDAAAAESPHFRVIRTPASGWPGRPRNLGIDAARGDYVFLADHDDRLAPDALERLVDFADERGSDVVIGRIVGVDRPAPTRIFARTLVDAQEDPGLLMTSLTPQKLYRRAFLNEHGIRFPEGPRRLEDHVFVTTAYVRARRVSVYADSIVYWFVLRDDGGNASRRPIEWAGYYANAAESVAVVDAEVPDEERRVVMRSRWLRTEALSRLRGRRLLGTGDRDGLLAAAGAFVRARYPTAEIDRLPAPDRLVGRLLLEGREADVVAFAEWEAALTPVVAVTDAEIAGDRLRVSLRAEPGWSAPLPDALQALPPDFPALAELEHLGDLPADAALEADLRRGDGVLVRATTTTEAADGVLTGTAAVDLASGALDGGAWRLRTALTGRSPAAPLVRAPVAAPPVSIGPLRVALAVDAKGRLLLRAERRGAIPAARRLAGRALRRLRR